MYLSDSQSPECLSAHCREEGGCYIFCLPQLGSQISVTRSWNVDRGYPRHPSLPGNQVFGFCQRSSLGTLWAEPRSGKSLLRMDEPACNLLQHGATHGPGASPIRMERDRESRICTTLERALFCIFFQEHIKLEILNPLYLKCSLALKMRTSVWTQAACIASSWRCEQFVFAVRLQACQGSGLDGGGLYFPGTESWVLVEDDEGPAHLWGGQAETTSNAATFLVYSIP